MRASGDEQGLQQAQQAVAQAAAQRAVQQGRHVRSVVEWPWEKFRKFQEGLPALASKLGENSKRQQVDNSPRIAWSMLQF